MTDITNQGLREARQWAEDIAETFKYDDETPRETRAAVNYLLATVEAPTPTLTEELRYLATALDNGDPDGTAPDRLRSAASRAEQIEQERDYLAAEIDKANTDILHLTAERDEARIAGGFTHRRTHERS